MRRSYHHSLPPFPGDFSHVPFLRGEGLAVCLPIFDAHNFDDERHHESASSVAGFTSYLPWHLGGLLALGFFGQFDVFVAVSDVTAERVCPELEAVGWPAERVRHFQQGDARWLNKIYAMRCFSDYRGVFHSDISLAPHFEKCFSPTGDGCAEQTPDWFSAVHAWDTEPVAVMPSTLFVREGAQNACYLSEWCPANWETFESYLGRPGYRDVWRAQSEAGPWFNLRGSWFGISRDELHTPRMDELLETMQGVFETEEGLLSLYFCKHDINDEVCFKLPAYHYHHMPATDGGTFHPHAKSFFSDFLASQQSFWR